MRTRIFKIDVGERTKEEREKIVRDFIREVRKPVMRTGEIMRGENIALFDMDQTIVDFDRQMHEDLDAMRSPDEEIVDPWDRKYPYMQARRFAVMRKEGWWRDLPPLYHGIKLLNDAKVLGFQIHILTKGPTTRPNAWSEKVEWCQKHLDMKDKNVKITITEDKGLVYGRILVDDYPDYVERWLQWRPRGLVIMPSNDTNVGFEHPNVIKYDYGNLEHYHRVIHNMRKVLTRESGEELVIE